MHGEISLDSTLGSGTTAVFSIPFNKPQFQGGNSPLVNLASIPDRLQSEMSVSGCTSDQDLANSTPPPTPHESAAGPSADQQDRPWAPRVRTPPITVASDLETALPPGDRKKFHVLVVEDK